MKLDINRFQETFFQEADEHVSTMEADLLRLEQQGSDPEALNAIFRCAHSIKGASGTFGFDDINRFTHSLETLLDGMRDGRVKPTPERTTLLLASVDVLRGLISAARSGGKAPDGADEVAARLIAAQRSSWDAEAPPKVRVDDLEPAQAVSRTYYIRFVPSGDVFQQGMDPILVLRELAQQAGELHDLKADISRLPGLWSLDTEVCYVSWRFRLTSHLSVEELRDFFAFVEDGAEIEIEEESATPEANIPQPGTTQSGSAQKEAPTMDTASGEPAPRLVARDATSIRVATEKVDKLVDLVGEVVIAQSMAAEILNNFSTCSLRRLQEAFAEMERHTRELQERVMGIRMLPIGSVFSRFPRMVRDLARTTGKEVALDVSGEETELDKGVVESLGDPLTHLIRNAIDHGLESPEERRSAGKPAQGMIRLHAYHQGGNVIVEVADDGRGLSIQKIHRKAIERGIVRESDELSMEQIRALVFEPGFSTAESVSAISGRGVGMDVVKRGIDSLNGTVGISSVEGRGTAIRIKLPLTLAILDGLLLKVGDQTYVLPLVAILESIRPSAHQLSTVAGQGEVVIVRGEPLPLVRLHRLFGIPTEVTDPTRGLLVVVENQGRRLAILVDELLGQQQVVIKSLETNFRKIDGVVGATILGDGLAALILDVSGLAQIAKTSRLAA